jgi:nitrogenase molybdenum-iron protein alpha/beta subunit
MKNFLQNAGLEVLSCWAMGSSLEEIAEAGRASVNLVVSSTGIEAARALKELFGTPYVVGTPIGSTFQKILVEELLEAVRTGEIPAKNRRPLMKSSLAGSEIAVIGEGVTALSLAHAIELEYERSVKILCTTECERIYLRDKDALVTCEDEIIEALQGVKMVIADPLYEPICPKNAAFIPLPAESFSGRIYRKNIPNLIAEFE